MKRLGLAQIPLMIVLLLMAIAVPVATKLVQQNQENRGKAYDAPECTAATVVADCGTGYNCTSGKCVPKATPSLGVGTTRVCTQHKCGEFGSCLTYTTSVSSTSACPPNNCTGPNDTSCPKPTKVPTLAIATLTPAIVPTGVVTTPIPTLPCVANDKCKAEGATCCSGYSVYSTTCVDKQVCKAVCIDDGKCKAEGATCCSGYSVYSTTCVDKQVCKAVTVTATPTLINTATCQCVNYMYKGTGCGTNLNKPCGVVTPAATCDSTKYKGEKASNGVWLHFDDSYTAGCICGGTDYHYVCESGYWACGDGSKVVTTCTAQSKCTQCAGKPDAKGKGDADCSGATNINDASIWRSEFIGGELGTVTKNSWRADYDCDGKVTINDISIWRANFIKGL